MKNQDKMYGIIIEVNDDNTVTALTICHEQDTVYLDPSRYCGLSVVQLIEEFNKTKEYLDVTTG